MCGIVAIAGTQQARGPAERALAVLRHRGPDADGLWVDEPARIALGHTRLSIVDLSDAGRQPMTSADGRYVITFNGEIYNYLELRNELADYPFRSRADTEIVLAAWSRWGAGCLDRLFGMFAFAIWDTKEPRLVAVRDRFGVKPLYMAHLDNGVALASEIKALHAAGVQAVEDDVTWATYLASGLTDYSSRTFWRGIESLPAGSFFEWTPRASSTVRWYDFAARVGTDFDDRDAEAVKAEYRALLEESVRLRFRSDVPVGINLSGGLDSSTLLGLVHAAQGRESDIHVFSFGTGDPNYDELPWVTGMLEHTRHPLLTCMLAPEDVPVQAARMTRTQDEPFGGLPTLAYATVFERARAEGVLVLLDGQGMDEQWAGYDYYVAAHERPAPIVQGSISPPVRIDCLSEDFRRVAESFVAPTPFPDRLRNLQLRDTLYTKIPRALRFNDRVSMAASTELREPFLDHRLFELAIRQPEPRKIRDGLGKWLLREVASELMPDGIRLAPKRALQTPQREWLRGPLRSWANDLIETAFRLHPEWFDVATARAAWHAYQAGSGDNSMWVWQWLSVALVAGLRST